VATAEATRLLAELNRIQTELNRELSRLVEDTRERGSDHALPAESAESAESAGAALPRSADLLLASSMEPVESGLLAVLERSFEEESGIHARHVATGSGEALSMVVAGRADLAVSHAPRAELGLLERGKLRDRAPLMTSRFVPACGPADPLGLRSRREPQRLDSLFAEIAAAEVPFVTRGDGSGTHLRELEIWERLGIDPSRQSWYHRAESQGSVGALHTAEALGGYTLVDALVMRAAGAPCVETADHELARNLYSVVGRGGSGGRGAEEFLTWIRSGHARDICERFGLVPAE
jgi:tungstate transport system substrate-binding protein